MTAESLGKKNKGILPIISNVPKDNHSVMQLYIDGIKNNFYSFFFLNEQNSKKVDFKRFSKRFKYVLIKNVFFIRIILLISFF